MCLCLQCIKLIANVLGVTYDSQLVKTQYGQTRSWSIRKIYANLFNKRTVRRIHEGANLLTIRLYSSRRHVSFENPIVHNPIQRRIGHIHDLGSMTCTLIFFARAFFRHKRRCYRRLHRTHRSANLQNSNDFYVL